MRWIANLAFGLIAGFAATMAAAAAERFETSAGPVTVERMAGGLSHPWAVAFLPGGAKLVTERGGRLWHFAPDWSRREVAGLPEVAARGQGGLLDVVAARDFAETREIFLTYAAPDGRGSRTTLAKARLAEDGAALEGLTVIWRQSPRVNSSKHFGSRIVEAPDGLLWVTIGDRGDDDLAQDLDHHAGKVVRVARDGSVPADNPFAQGGGLPEIWSYGHRNPQGAALDPETGALWTVEHGARGGDEVNRPEPGRNYGWPVISYGTHYSGWSIGEGTHKDGMEQPKYYWDPSIAPSGMAIYSGRLWPGWAGHVFVGSLKYQLISRLAREGGRIIGEEHLFMGEYGRIRDVREGPGGALWFVTDRDEGALYRVTPAE